MKDATAQTPPRPSLFVRIVNYVFIVVGVVVFACAIIGIPELGGRPGKQVLERDLRIGAGIGIVLCLYVAVRRVKLGALVLVLSLLYFFVSCGAVFHWKGG